MSEKSVTVMPSLERMTLVKVAISLWNCEISKVSGIDLQASDKAIRVEWQEIENKVLGKVPQLPLPQPLKEKVLCFIKPIGLEIFKWIRYHHKNCCLEGILPNDRCWTPQGIINKVKTAKVLIEDENLDITNRYRLACVYCLEDKIRQLWEKISSDFRILGNFKIGSELVTFWTLYINRKISNTFSFRAICSLALSQIANCKAFVNKAAIEYFFSKLTPAERDELISTFLDTPVKDGFSLFDTDADNHHEKYYYFEVLRFLQSLMTEEQQNRFITMYKRILLIHFLDWPLQSCFEEMFGHLRPDFHWDKKYCFLLVKIINKIMKGFMDYDYETLFVKCWKQSFTSKKSCVRFERNRRILLRNLLEIKDEDNIRLILEHATITEKKRFIFGSRGIFKCKMLIDDNEWSVLEFIIQGCKFSKTERIEFQEKLSEYTGFQFIENNKEKWVRFIQLLDDNICENYLRKSETEDENGSAKRLHSSECDVTNI